MKYYCKIYISRTEEIEVNAKGYKEAKEKALNIYANGQCESVDEEISEVDITQVH